MSSETSPKRQVQRFLSRNIAWVFFFSFPFFQRLDPTKQLYALLDAYVARCQGRNVRHGMVSGR